MRARSAFLRRLSGGLLYGGLALSVTVLSGCGDLDPYQKPYAWYPTGAPTANIAAQLVNPNDLNFGRGTNEGDAKEAVLAIEHAWQDHTKAVSPAASGGGGGTSGGSGSSSGGTN